MTRPQRTAGPAAARVRLVLAAAPVGLAGLSFAPVFDPTGFPGPPALVVAVLAPVVAVVAWGLVTSLRTARPGGAASALGVVVVLATVAVVTRPGAEVAAGPRRLLSAALPVDAAGPELAAVSALTGFAALVAVWTALVSPVPPAPLPPAVLCLVAGLSLGANAGELPGWYPVAFLVLVVALLVGSRLGEQGRGALVGVALGAGAITLVASVAVPLASPALGGDGRAPADARALVDLPVQPRARVNPFAQYVALREGMLPLEITGTASRPFPLLRMVTLTEFDGHTWSVHADYRRAGQRLPTPAAEGTAPRRPVRMDATVRYPDTLGWLPSPGRPQQVSIGGLGVDERTGDVVIPDTRSAPAGYRVDAVENVPAPEVLRTDEPAPGGPLGVTVPPDVLEFTGSATTAVSATGFARFAALYGALRDPSFVTDRSEAAPGGHGLYAISELLRDRRGTSEQYASAFALMCRSLGWDARVVLGFQPSFTGAASPGGAAFTARGEDVHAWVEVRFARSGWVTVDPTPQRTVDDDPSGTGSPPPAGGDDPVAAAAGGGEQAPPESGRPGQGTAQQAGRDAGVHPALLVGLVAAGLVAAALAVPLGKAVRRSARRRRGTSRQRTLAAWWEVVDRLVESGMSTRRSTTTADVVAAAPGTPEVAALGALADRAAFAPDEPSTADAETAWHRSDELRRVISRRMSLPQRLRAAFDPRPLWRAARRRAGAARRRRGPTGAPARVQGARSPL